MELTEAMRTTGTCRYFRPDPVPDEVLHAAFDAARFGPQGGNRQPMRWIVVRDAAAKQALADLYLPLWKAYFDGIASGDVNVGALPRSVTDADTFAENLATVPAIVVACAELAGLHPTDAELGRLSVVGGGSIYPTVQNLCLQTGPEDTWLFVMPFFTIAGLGSMTTLTLMGATLVLPATVDPSTALGIIEREGVTVIAQTPTFYLALSGQPAFGAAAVGTVRRCMTYGGQVAPAAIEAWSAAAPDVRWGTYWGQSELSQLGTVGWFRTLDDIPGGDPSWIGKPVTHLETRVVDAEGDDAEIGELICRSPSVMLGYHRDPERTEAALGSGWLHTRDIVRVDAEGNLFFQDRLTDMIKSGGMNVSSQEVERVLHTHPDVLRAAVVGRPDPYWSEAVTAFVVPRPGREPDPAAVMTFCREQLAVFKVPKAVHVVAELPVDAQGKVLKRELRRAAV